MANVKPIVLNAVYSTVQAGSTAIGSSSATGITVTTGNGANFGTINTDEFIPCVVVDTSTSPETVKEYVWVTAIASDTLTVVRAAEQSARFPASTTTIQAGFIIAACATKSALDYGAGLMARYMKPDIAYAETFPRQYANTASVAPTSGTLYLTAIALPVGMTIGHIAVASSATGNSVPTNWWFGLYDASRVQLAVTANQLTAGWAGNTMQNLAIATIASGASSTFTTTYTGLYYIGIMQAYTTRAANLICTPSATSPLPSQAPICSGTSDTTQTVIPSFPHTATAITSQSATIWAAVGP